jgi:hypothetical protein
MALTAEEGTSTPGSTETTLNATSPETTKCIMQAFFLLSGMVDGDTFEIRVKEKVISGGAQGLVTLFTITNQQAEPAYVTPALLMLNGWDVTLKQTAGSNRPVPWSIRKVTG